MSSSSSEIEIVDKTSASSSRNEDICQLCSNDLGSLSKAERDVHYRQHRSGQAITSSGSKRARRKPASTPQGKTPRMKLGKNARNAAREDVFWHPALTASPPDNYSPGVLSILKEALKISYRKGAIRRAVLCYERTPHIYHEPFDTTWGCGYRNFLMTCAALMGQQSQVLYFPNLDSPSPPGVRNLQRWLEDAWELGYDESGADELDHKLVDTKKKIGTGELYVAFTSRRIPCTLVDFDLSNSHKGFDTITEWVVNYFTEKREGDVNTVLRATSPVVATDKMPIILQYEGHSMTIVGYELGKNDKYNLLAFDPSSSVNKIIRQVALDAPATVNWKQPSSIPFGKTKHHEQSKSPVPRKRLRTSDDPDNEVLNIPDSDEEEIDDEAHRVTTSGSALDPEDVVKAFRFKGTKRKSDYQLLYFTLGELLSDQQQNERKVVFSVRGC